MAGDPAITHDAGMIENCVREIIRVMAKPTIVDGCRVRGSGRLIGSINTIATVVTGFAGLYCGINQAVVENAAHVKADDTMTGTTIDCRYGVTVRWPDCVYAMAGIAAEVRDNRGGVVGKSVQESFNRMTGYAVRVGDRMSAGRGIDGRRRLTDSSVTVVATAASTGNTRMIETTIGFQLKKTGGIVAVVALGAGRLMKLGFTDGQNPVMAFAAVAKHFLMVDKRS